MSADANLENFPSQECFVRASSDQLVVAGSEEDDEGREAIRRSEEEDGDDRNARQRKLNYSTKVFEGVPIIVKGDFNMSTTETYIALCGRTESTNCF